MKKLFAAAVGIAAILVVIAGITQLPIGTGDDDPADTVETTYKVPGLSAKTPKALRERLRQAVAAVEGVEAVRIREASKTLWLRHDVETDMTAVKQAITGAGFALPSKRKASPSAPVE